MFTLYSAWASCHTGSFHFLADYLLSAVSLNIRAAAIRQNAFTLFILSNAATVLVDQRR